ncbi:MAG: hypothetical protein LBU36_08030, partial [Clostridiales bacterium]|nr:hypothetical protein [Clostridiales bacterium]
MPESHDDGTGSMQTLRSAKEFYNNAQSKIDVTKVVYGDVKQTSIDAKNAAQKVNDFSQKLFKRTDLGLKTRVNRSLTKRKVRTVKTVNVKKSYQTRQYVAKTQKAAEKAKYAAAKAAETIRKIALAAKSAAAAPAVMVGALVIVLLCVVVASANALFSGNQTTVI